MKFYDYQDIYAWDSEIFGDMRSHIKNHTEYLNFLEYQVVHHPETDPVFAEEQKAKVLLARLEEKWIAAKRPYYDIYPSMIPILEGLKLDFPLEEAPLPQGLGELLIRFPEGHDIKAVFLAYRKFADEKFFRMMMNCLFARPVCGEDKVNITISWSRESTGESVFNRMLDGENDQNEEQFALLKRVFTVGIGICLIGNDPEIVEQQVLSKDLAKLTDANREQLINKAVRRGKFGFSLGKELEKIPHLRRPHPCWVAYGPGRKLRKLKLRKGSIVHREKIEKMPTGLLDA